MPEGNVVDGGVDELVLHPFALLLAHAREAERVKLFSPSVMRVVVVHGVRGRADHRPFRDESAVNQRDVLQRLPLYRYWRKMILASRQ